MSFIDFIGLLTALGFFMVWLDMKASTKLFKSMRNDISILHARIVKLERGQEKSS